MCLAIPTKVIALYENQQALVNVGGIEKTISTSLLEEVTVGDYVIIHVGYALTRLDEEEAEKTLEMIRSISSS